MAIRPIITREDETLGKVCHRVTRFDDRLAQLIDDLRETLEQAQGYGLAAPQVGILRRVCLVTGSDGEFIELVNPEIVDSSGEQEGFEGCLSVPGLYGWVKRPRWVKVRAQDRRGNPFEVEDVDMSARCFFHEIAHLDGHLFTELVKDGRLYTEEEIDAMQQEQERREKGGKGAQRGKRRK